MPKITLTHDINCDVDTFWKVFFDKSFNEALFRDKLSFPKFEIVQQREDDKQLYRKVSGVPKMDAPAPVVKLMGNSFSYVEEGTWDKATKAWKWKMTPSTLADKTRNEGTMRVEAAGPGKCRRVSDIFIEVKVFAIGGLVESTIEKNFRDGWGASAVFMNQWIADGKAK